VIHLDVGQRLRDRAGGDDDVLGLEDLLGAALGERDLDLALPGDLAVALDHLDLVLLHQVIDAVGPASDDLRLVLHRRRQLMVGDFRSIPNSAACWMCE
jgi:hypothetical protein